MVFADEAYRARRNDKSYDQITYKKTYNIFPHFETVKIPLMDGHNLSVAGYQLSRKTQEDGAGNSVQNQLGAI